MHAMSVTWCRNLKRKVHLCPFLTFFDPSSEIGIADEPTRNVVADKTGLPRQNPYKSRRFRARLPNEVLVNSLGAPNPHTESGGAPSPTTWGMQWEDRPILEWPEQSS